LWQQLPEAEAATNPLPHSWELLHIFESDPYYSVQPPSSSSQLQHYLVKLDIAKIKMTLNW
jgi:hypothetical protein